MNDTYVLKEGQQLKLSEFKRLNFTKNNEVARVISTKLIKDNKNTGTSGYNGTYVPNDGTLNTLSKQTATNIEDAANIFQTLPDIKIAMEIWSSCILTPKDGITESLIWSVDTTGTKYSSLLFGLMLEHVKSYFEEDYDIFHHLKPAVEDALFKTGSYPLVIIPESSVDDIINGRAATSNEKLIDNFYLKTKEGYKSPALGILGNPSKIGEVNKRVGLESIIRNSTFNQKTYQQIHEGMTITDNPEILKFQLAISRNKKKQLRHSLNQRYGLEAYAKVDLSLPDSNKEGEAYHSNPKTPEEKEIADRRFDKAIKEELIQKLYKDRTYTPQKILRVHDQRRSSRMTIGHPLVMKIPSSAIIPVHVPGKPSDIVGAFIVLDEYGNPLDSSENTDLYNESRENSEGMVNSANNIIKQMNFFNDSNFNVLGGEKAGTTFNELAKSYAALFEEDLLSRFANGVYGENVVISRSDELYRIMLARACQAMRTQLLYVPGELLTYFAFDYNKFGIGKSLLEDGRMLATMRATMLYAQIYADVQNSIGRRKLSITLDESTPDPTKAAEVVRAEYLRATAFNMPLLSDSPVDAINTLREAGIDFDFTGDTPALPTSKVEVEDINTSRNKPDDEITDKIRNLHISSLGLPASIVDETQNTEFATTAMTAHSLFNKRVINYQNILNDKFLYDHITKYVLNSGRLIKELSYIIKENKVLLTQEQRAGGNALPIIEDFLDCLLVKLPMPDNTKLSNNKDDFENFKSMLDDVVDAVIPTDVLEKLLPEDENMDTDIGPSIIKNIIMRKFILDNNYCPELIDILDKNNIDKVREEILTYLKPLATFTKQAKDELQAISGNTGEEEDADSSDDSYSSSSDDDSSSSFSDDSFGSDDTDDSDDSDSGDDTDDEDEDTSDDSDTTDSTSEDEDTDDSKDNKDKEDDFDLGF